jgi:hypothetical protein
VNVTLTIGVVSVAAGTGLAQVGGQATWLWEVTTQNGDAVVEPDESATITLSVGMTPDIGQGSLTQGFAQATFDVLGGTGADTGEIVDWKILNNLDLLGDPDEIDGVNIIGVTALQTTGDPFNDADPIDVFEFVWKPGVYDDRVVEYSTFSDLEDHGDHLIIVWVGEDVWKSHAELWPIDEAMISFQVVPAPPSALLLALAGIAAARRRRH